MADLVAEGVEATVSPIIRETVAAVREFGRKVSEAELTKKLGLNRGTVSRRVAQALDRGYLRNPEWRKGYPARLDLGDPLPDGVEVLPRPEALQGGCCSVAVETGGTGDANSEQESSESEISAEVEAR